MAKRSASLATEAPGQIHLEEIGRRWSGARELVPLLVPIDEIHLDPANLKKHDEFNLTTIAASLRTHGQVEPLVVRPDGSLVGGEGRLLAIQQDPELQWTHVARVVYRGSDQDARRLAILLNRTPELGSWDPGGLAAYFEQAESEELLLLGWRQDDVNDFMASLGEEEPARAPEVPEERPQRQSGAPHQVTLIFVDGRQYADFRQHVAELGDLYNLEAGDYVSVVCEAVRRAVEARYGAR